MFGLKYLWWITIYSYVKRVNIWLQWGKVILPIDSAIFLREVTLDSTAAKMWETRKRGRRKNEELESVPYSFNVSLPLLLCLKFRSGYMQLLRLDVNDPYPISGSDLKWEFFLVEEINIILKFNKGHAAYQHHLQSANWREHSIQWGLPWFRTS